MSTPADKFLESFAAAIKIDTGEIYDRAKRFIQQNISPDEVFTVQQLEEWYRVHSKLKDKKSLLLSQARELDPEDVFDFEDLKKWSIENGFVRDWTKTEEQPEEIFPRHDLEQWALKNGFVRSTSAPFPDNPYLTRDQYSRSILGDPPRTFDCEDSTCTACLNLEGDDADQI